jgi:RHS repeat-associated protein
MTASLPVTTVGLGVAMLQARLGSSTAEAAAQVISSPAELVSLAPSALNAGVGATGQFTVNLNAAQPTATTVALLVDEGGVLQVPSTVVIPAGQISATFGVTGLAAGAATVSAQLGQGPARTAAVQVVPPPPAIQSLLPSPLVLQQGATGSLTLTLNAAQRGDTAVPLSTDAPRALQIPESVTIPAGQLSAQIPITGLIIGTGKVCAEFNGTRLTASVEIIPPPVRIGSLTPGSQSLPKGTVGVLHVTVTSAPKEPTPIPLTSSATPIATVPDTVTIPAGSLEADFPVLAQGEGAATLTATLNGSVSSQITVAPPELMALAVSPDAPTLFAGQTLQLSATGTFTDASTQDVTSTVTWTSSSETVATVDGNGVLTARGVGSATIAASSGSVSDSTIVTVQTPPSLSLNPSVATLQVGQFLALTVSSTVPAEASGLTVSLLTAGSGSIVVPSSVVIPPSQTSAPVIVSGAAPGTVSLTATAIAHSPAISTLTVTLGVPTISNFTPLTGPPGTVVTINGANFDPAPGKTTVTFNGAAAIVSSVTTNAITATVPMGATTGTIRVATPLGTATSATSFVVTSSQDFSFSGAPSALTLPASGQGAFTLSLSGTANFAGLVSLSVAGLPPGISANFSASTLTAGQSTALILSTGGAASPGSYPITVTATGVIDGVQASRTVSLTVQVQGSGVTNLAGQVLDEEEKPVKGAKVKLGALEVFTDEGGNFLIVNPPVGSDQLLFIDGSPASTPERSFPIIPYKVAIVAGVTNTLGFTPHLHFQKITGLTDISNSGMERTITDPGIPGFQMVIPAGVTITGWDGQPDTQISIRRVPVDRLPIPSSLPGDRYSPVVYMDYFGKPGGGTPSAPIPVTLPNDLQAPPGTKVELWFYDEAPDGSRPNEWRQYGTGTVSADGLQIVPDIDPTTGRPYGQPRFCCGALRAALASLNGLVGFVPLGAHGTGVEGGDPVDLSTGVFVLKKTDLILPGRLPVTFTRMYRTMGATSGPFGPGTSHSYHILLLIENNMRTLMLPGGARVLFVSQPDGTFRNLTAPSYQGSVLTGTATGHTLRFKDGATWTFGADTLGTAFLMAQTDRNGNTILLERTGLLGTLTKITDSVGREILLTYSGNSITEIRDPMGRIVQYSYDANGRLASVTDPAGFVTRYTYDPLGRILTITDGRGITFLTNEYYDDGGRVRRQIQANGVWQFAYTVAGGAVSKTAVTDPLGHTTAYRFNGQGYLIEQTDALGQTTMFTRDSSTNLLQATTDPLGRKTTFTYDASGNITAITDAAGNATRLTYEPTFSRLTELTDALGQKTRFVYDAKGNLLSTTDPLNQTTTIAYNEFGQPTSVTDPLGNRTTFAYDAQGNLTVTTDPLGNATQRAYDVVSRLTSLTDPRGFATQFQYDALNRVTSIAAPDHGVTRFTYDQNGNLLEVGDAKGQVTTYAYDPMDRLSTRTDALGRQEAYLYDQLGNLTQFRDRKNQTTVFGYDATNRRTRAGYADGSSTNFVYDSVGRLTSAEDSLSGRIELAYDILDRLVKELTPQGVVEYAYDALGRRTTMTANGGVPVTYSYDAASRLTQVAQGMLAVGLGYDAAGRRTSLNYPNGTSTSYSYDAASRVTNIAHNGPAGLIESLAYTYDAAGSRISLTRANGTASLLPAAVQAAYDAANEQIRFNSTTPNLTYDANGNLISFTDASGTTTYTWDARNRLVGISGPALSASFQYDVLGRRISKTINGVTTQFLYDGNDIVAEIGGGAVGASYVRSLNIDEPFVRQANTTEFYHTDALGSTLALTNTVGTAAVSYSYEAFGKTSITGTSSNPFQYTGRENDGTGLYYYRVRYYQTGLHRFVGEDVIRIRLGHPNLYPYVSNNPLRFSDPFGLIRVDYCSRQTGCDVTGDIPEGIDPEQVRQAIREKTPINTEELDRIKQQLFETAKKAAKEEAARKAKEAIKDAVKKACETTKRCGPPILIPPDVLEELKKIIGPSNADAAFILENGSSLDDAAIGPGGLPLGGRK